MFDPYTVNTTSRLAGASQRLAARRNAHAQRNALVAELAAKGGETAAAPFTRRRMTLFGAALVLATVAFAFGMFAAPPVSEAADVEGLSIAGLQAGAPLDMGAAEFGYEN